MRYFLGYSDMAEENTRDFLWHTIFNRDHVDFPCRFPSKKPPGARRASEYAEAEEVGNRSSPVDTVDTGPSVDGWKTHQRCGY